MLGHDRAHMTIIRPRRCGAVALALVLALLAGPAAAGDFLEAAEDLPLAPGLVEDHEAAMVFDKPGGRIVETRASGRHSSAAVAAFYSETLPQLGWTSQAGDRAGGAVVLRFARAREALSLVISESDGGVVVRFAITPR